MVSKKKNSITEKYSIILKIIGFSMLAIAGYMDLTNSNNTILTDPFALGATLMVIASIMMLVKPGVNYNHTALFFFIFAKIIAQYTHSHHYDFWGQVKHV
jgi:hypothetical protein